MIACQSRAPLAVSVVPTSSGRSYPAAVISMADADPRGFFVVLTNLSKKPQAVWKDGNSWGYQIISFNLMLADGKSYTVSRRDRNFGRNGPGMFVIEPGEHEIYPVLLNDDWEVQPPLPKEHEMTIALKAVYDVPKTDEALKYGVWSGRIESRSYNWVLMQK